MAVLHITVNCIFSLILACQLRFKVVNKIDKYFISILPLLEYIQLCHNQGLYIDKVC